MNFGKVLLSIFLGFFIPWAVITGAYSLGKYLSKEAAPSSWVDKLKTYLFMLGFAAVISLFIWAGYGTHTEGDYYEGPRGDNETGDVAVDFEPTATERNEYGMKVFLVLLLPLLYGAYKAQSVARAGQRKNTEASKRTIA